jgi:hypothetical protein
MSTTRPKPPRPDNSATLELYKLLASEKFLSWRPEHIRFKTGLTFHMMAEKHYTPAELAKMWGVDPETIRNVFRNEPGVLKLRNDNRKRTYITLRIPESIAERVHRRLSA